MRNRAEGGTEEEEEEEGGKLELLAAIEYANECAAC